MKNVRVGIIGGAGYTAGELIRLLLNHPAAELVFVQSSSNAGKALWEVHEGLFGETDMKFTDRWPVIMEARIADAGGVGGNAPRPLGVQGDSSPQDVESAGIDVLFLCGGHGASRDFWAAHSRPAGLKVIDLAQDFRDESCGYVYGLPELKREAIKGADSVANPGCFATAITLALLPLAAAGLLRDEISVTAITGSTGAGVKPGATTHFSWRNDNVSAYKIFEHQHLPEIRRSLSAASCIYPENPSRQPENISCQPGGASNQPGSHLCHARPDRASLPPISFIPLRGSFSRGIFAAAHTPCDLSEAEARKLYQDFYASAPFTFVSPVPVDLKQVTGTNKCLLQLEKHDGRLVVCSVIDNLLKGASGQAVQNMNLMCGLPEDTGLHLKATAF